LIRTRQHALAVSKSMGDFRRARSLCLFVLLVVAINVVILCVIVYAI
jgi:hypothetical protein